MSGRSNALWTSAIVFAFAAGIGGGLFGPMLWHKATTPVPVTPVQIYDVNDTGEGEIDHFAGVRTVIRRANASERLGTAISLKLMVAPDGKVISVTPTLGPKEFYSDAVALALTWNLKPYLRNGQPVMARVNGWVEVYPPERRRDYPVPFPPVRDNASVKITLDRTPCFGTCPGYRVELHGDGSVDYEGHGFVVVAGKHHAMVPVAVVRHLVEQFRKADFFSLLPRYVSEVTDNPTYTIGISFDGYAAQVQDYAGEPVGMPHAVRELEDEIDRVLGTRRWTRGNRETVPSLLAEGWDFKADTCINTALVAGAAKYASVDVVRALLVQGAPVHVRCSEMAISGTRIPALQSAVVHGDVPMLDALLEAGAQRYDDDFQRALITAAEQGDDALLMRLRRSKFDALRAVRLDDGETLLMAAASSCVPRVVESALFRADVNAANKDGDTALFYAIRGGAYGKKDVDCAQTVKLLLNAGAKVEGRGEYGRTPLMAVSSDPKVAKVLIAAGADVQARGPYGDTALMSSYDPKLTDALLQAGADPWAVNNDGKTALQLAKEGGWSQKEIVRLLEAWMKAHPRPKK